jgi:hypothetical protein
MARAIDRGAHVVTRLVTPVDVSLWTMQTALIACCPVGGSFASIASGRAPVTPVARQELDGETQALGELVPQRGEVARSPPSAHGRRARAC